MNFNKDQSLAIRHFSGPCMILAGPGSGKTTVIANRIRNLTEEYKVPPEKILVITFTRAAAEEMKERYRVLTGGEQGVAFGTFHALFFKIIRYAYRYDSSNILTEDERTRFIRDAAQKAGAENTIDGDLILALSNEIGRIKNSGGDLKKIKSRSVITDKSKFEEIYTEFERTLRAEKKLDFDDMMLLCLRLFKEHPEVLKYWQELYEYILIDEFQDISPLQYELIKLLSESKKNIFVVGDDDQSIYAFRGASPEMMFDFEKDYKKVPGYERITLGVNYRCSPEIVECSSRLIAHNKKRFKKELKSGRGGLLKGLFKTDTVIYRDFQDVAKEFSYAVNMIENLIARGIDPSEIAVLYRVNTQPGLLVSKLKERNIKFVIRDTVSNIYDHWVAKNIFAYMELAAINGNTDGGVGNQLSVSVSGTWRDLFLQIANRPTRYIRRESLRRADLSFETLYRENADKAYVRERLDKLKYDLAMLSKLPPKAAVNYIRKAVGYDGFLKKYAEERLLDADGLFDILNELDASAAEFSTYADWKKHIEEYTEALRRRSSEKKEKETGVGLLTFHSAKGMEFDTVFVIDASEDYTPYWQAATSAEIEEERRMFYVALTRAKNRLFVLHADDRFGKKREPSRFLKEARLL
ncbi:MAG: ATP-dependent helicase [Lachnospiraceae bacterium]|nr:ATP-dependent helicase [Lachnospiraceae bacterium]